MKNQKNYIYLNDEIKTSTDCSISILDRGFLFSEGVYEVAMCYNGKPFLFKEHLMRLENSLKHIQIKQPTIDLEKIAQFLLLKNNLTEETSTKYIQITRAVALRKH